MTPQPAVISLTLDPATTDETLATIFGAQRHDPDRTPVQLELQRDAAVALIATLRPRDPLEAAYASRAVAAHYGSMECFRRAMFADLPDNAAIRLHGKAEALSRMNTEMVRTLREHQAATLPAQPQPAARPSVPPPPSPAPAAHPASPTKPPGRQDPMPSERPSEHLSPAPVATIATQPATTATQPATTATQPAAARAAQPPASQHRMSSVRPQPPLSSAAVRAQLAAGLRPRTDARQDPMSSERRSYSPPAGILATGPAATCFLAASPPRRSLRAELLGTTAEVAAVLESATARIKLHAQ